MSVGLGDEANITVSGDTGGGCKYHLTLTTGIFIRDHQRMMVDPMFMIIQSFRSFLTAITPTAVAPIAITLPVFT